MPYQTLISSVLHKYVTGRLAEKEAAPNSHIFWGASMGLRVDAQLIKKQHRLVISYGGQIIGEYERAQESDIDRKKAEIKCALAMLLDIHRRKGEFTVRWDGKRRVKSIRVNGVEVGLIPHDCWRKPSWEICF